MEVYQFTIDTYEIMNNVEDWMYVGAMVPFLGSIVGVAKVGVGALQAITALVASILFLIPALFSENARELLKCSVTHIAHGLGNIMMGICEAFPCGGLILLGIRTSIPKGMTNCATPKFLGYEDLSNSEKSGAFYHI